MPTLSQLRDFIRAIRKIIAEEYDNGTPGNIAARVDELARRMNIDSRTSRAFAQREEARRMAGFTADNTSEIDAEITSFISGEAAGVAENLTDDVLDLMRRSMSSGEDVQIKLKRMLGSAEKYSKQIENTAKAAIASEASNRAAQKAAGTKDPLMRYAGPIKDTSRSFCKDHLGEIRPLSEWRAMKNQFDQSVALFRGGWRCAHRLVNVHQ
jgi:hypothetical protein